MGHVTRILPSSLPPVTPFADYKLRLKYQSMEEKEKQEWCRRCHGGRLHPTLDPNEMKCNYCGWSKFVVDLKDYMASKAYVGP